MSESDSDGAAAEATDPKIIIDGNSNHVVMDNILRFCDRSTLFAWRQVNTRFQDEADSILVHHVVFKLRKYKPSNGLHPEVREYRFVDPMGRPLPGWRHAKVVIHGGRARAHQKLWQVTWSVAQFRHARHVNILDCPSAWTAVLSSDSLPTTLFPGVKACRVWDDYYPQGAIRLAEPSFTDNPGGQVESTAVVFGQLPLSDPFRCLGVADRHYPRKLVHHMLPESEDVTVLLGPIAHANRDPLRWGERTTLVIVFSALIDWVRKMVLFANICYLLESAEAAGCFPTSIIFVGVEEILAQKTSHSDASDSGASDSDSSDGHSSDRNSSDDHPSDSSPPDDDHSNHNPSGGTAPNIIDQMRAADDWYPPHDPDDKNGDRRPICERALPYLANLMETGFITPLSLEDYAATLTQQQQLIELVPSASNIWEEEYSDW